MTDECVELKNIKYKTMLLSPENTTLVDYKTKQNLTNLDELIKQDKLHAETLPWSKLNKTMKLGKLDEFVENYSKTHNMTSNEKNELIKLLHDSLSKNYYKKQRILVMIKMMVQLKVYLICCSTKVQENIQLKM